MEFINSFDSLTRVSCASSLHWKMCNAKSFMADILANLLSKSTQVTATRQWGLWTSQFTKQHGFRQWLGAVKSHAIIWTKSELVSRIKIWTQWVKMPFASEIEFTPNFYLNGHDSLIFVINTVILLLKKTIEASRIIIMNHVNWWDLCLHLFYVFIHKLGHVNDEVLSWAPFII